MVSLKRFLIFPILAIRAAKLEAPIPGYKVVDFEWHVDVFPGKPPVSLNGTVEHVIAQAQALNPKWNATILQPALEGLEPSEATINGRDSEKRRFGRTDCSPPQKWEACNGAKIENGIAYLRKVPGKPGAVPGPGACGRVSCSYHAAIWWCNDNRRNFFLNSFGDIADGAQEIFNKCTTKIYFPNYPPTYLTLGQSFSDDKWNVIVREDTNDC